MDNLILLAVLGFLLLFGALVTYMVRAEKRSKAGKLQVAQSLGFTPIEPEPDLVRTINRLYKERKSASGYEMRNVARKIVPDGEVYLFDLESDSGDDDRHVEDRVVAVRSRYLDMPAFILFPQVASEGAGVNLANQLLRWVVSKIGEPVEFPDYPEFQERYLVSSPDPAEVRKFLDANRIHLLEKTHLCSIQARGGMFTFTMYNPKTKPHSVEAVSERVNRALEIFQIFSR